MAAGDRCCVCDYNPREGSSFAGIPPGKNGRVRLNNGDFYCDYCVREIGEAMADYGPAETKDE